VTDAIPKTCDRAVGANANELRESVRLAYSAAATAPNDKHSFPIGAAFAHELGYPQELLNRIPVESAEAFTGVSNVSLQAPLRDGLLVLDLGCGSGLDSLVAAERVGPNGRVVGIDFSGSMLDRASRSAKGYGHANLAFVQASAEHMPLHDSSVDMALVNGIFNLNPFHEKILHELFRVLRPGGHVFGAELILKSALPEHLLSGTANWFS
jgi:arsenite methyltransferase